MVKNYCFEFISLQFRPIGIGERWPRDGPLRGEGSIYFFYLLFLALFLLSSCSSLESGRFIQMREKDTLETLAKEFKVPTWKIESSNFGKKFRGGEMIFIPLQRGFLRVGEKRPHHQLKKADFFIWPVPSSKKVTSYFGRRWGKKHDGIDISAKSGAHILATANGVIVYSGNKMGGYGNITVVAHNHGYFSIYAHAKKNYTKKGQKVYKGQVIATVGSTGRSTGSHLHFEVRKNGKSLDPISLIGP